MTPIYDPEQIIDGLTKRVKQQDGRIAELEAVLVEPCRYHHLPLINGWAHKIDDMGHPKTIRCTLSEKARALLKGKQS